MQAARKVGPCFLMGPIVGFPLLRWAGFVYAAAFHSPFFFPRLKLNSDSASATAAAAILSSRCHGGVRAAEPRDRVDGARVGFFPGSGAGGPPLPSLDRPSSRICARNYSTKYPSGFN